MIFYPGKVHAVRFLLIADLSTLLKFDGNMSWRIGIVVTRTLLAFPINCAFAINKWAVLSQELF